MAKCPRSKRRARKGNRWTGKRKLEKGREGRKKEKKMKGGGTLPDLYRKRQSAFKD